MKIAIWHNLPSGGGKRALYDQVKGLLDRGHEIVAWCPPTADKSYLPLGDLIQENVFPLSEQKSGTKDLLRALISGPYHYGAAYQAMMEHCRGCAEEIKKGEFDIFLGNTCVQYRAGPIGRFIDLPKVLYLQEPFRWYYEALPELPWIAPNIEGGLFEPSLAQKKLIVKDQLSNHRIRLLARQELESVKVYDRVLANSLFSRESMLRAYGIDAKVSYLGIDASHFKVEKLARKNTIVGVGSFDSIKNIEFVIHAVSLLSDLQPELVWIGNSGDSAYMVKLKALAKALNVNYSPKMMIPDSEMIEILNTARVMAYGPRLEPFGLTPLEGNCCGLPVVGVAEGGVRETISNGNNGLLVEPDENAMASAIRSLLENPVYAEELGLKARQWAIDNWSMDKSIDRLESHLKRTLDDSKLNKSGGNLH